MFWKFLKHLFILSRYEKKLYLSGTMIHYFYAYLLAIRHDKTPPNLILTSYSYFSIPERLSMPWNTRAISWQMGWQNSRRMQVPARDCPAAANDHLPQAVWTRALPAWGVLRARRGDIQQARVGKHSPTIANRVKSNYKTVVECQFSRHPRRPSSWGPEKKIGTTS